MGAILVFRRSFSHMVVFVAMVCVLTTTQATELRNVAIGKPALLDSNYQDAPSVTRAGHAVDGNTSSNLWSGSCAHSSDANDYPKWWIVDLLKSYQIRQVLITNRDSYSGRLRNFTIDVFDEHPNSMSGFPDIEGKFCAYQPATDFPGASETKRYTCTQPVTGRYLRVIKYNNFALVMCEVQVMAVKDKIHYYAERRRGVKPNLLAFETRVNIRSYVRCAALCGQNDHCNAFSWNRVTHLCGFLKDSPYSTSLILINDPDTDVTFNFQSNSERSG